MKLENSIGGHEIKPSRLLTDTVVDRRPIALGRSGIILHTDVGNICEVAGGSHATTIVNDNGVVLRNAFEQLGRVAFALTGRGASHVVQVELAETVCELFGSPQSRIFFTSGGTEAIETACRLAYHLQKLRGKTAASVLVGRSYSYHGMSLLTRNIAHHPVHSEFGSDLDFRWPKLPEPRCLRCPMGLSRDQCSIECAGTLTEIVRRYGPDKIAAVIVEPASGSTGGALFPPLGYLERIVEIAREHGILVIADETVTAFGRTGEPFVTNAGIADIVVGGKCLGGGFVPLNAVIVTPHICKELADYEVPVPLRLTFSGNPINCLVAGVAQEYVASNGLLRQVQLNTEIIRDAFVAQCALQGIPASINGKGHLWALEVGTTSGDGENLSKKMRKVATQCGVEFMGGWTHSESADFAHIMFTPPFDATHQEIMEAIERVVTVARRAKSWSS